MTDACCKGRGVLSSPSAPSQAFKLVPAASKLLFALPRGQRRSWGRSGKTRLPFFPNLKLQMATDVRSFGSPESVRDMHPSCSAEVNLSAPFRGVREECQVLSKLGNRRWANLGTDTLHSAVLLSAQPRTVFICSRQEDTRITANTKRGQLSWLCQVLTLCHQVSFTH